MFVSNVSNASSGVPKQSRLANHPDEDSILNNSGFKKTGIHNENSLPCEDRNVQVFGPMGSLTVDMMRTYW